MICVLLATYNGRNWLPDWLRSLASQTEQRFELLVRDDGSGDGTAELLDGMDDGARRRIVREPPGRLGAAANFATLLAHARSSACDYFAPADQDDIWLPHKLERQLGAVRAAERRWGESTPILVHTDLRVVDGRLRDVHPSHSAYYDVRRGVPESELVRTLLAHNVVTGCAAMINRALLELAVPVPPNVAMHDWWLALCAAVVGRIEYLPETTVLYRRHDANVTAGRRGLLRFVRPAEAAKTRENLQRGIEQVVALRKRLDERGMAVDRSTATVLEDYAALADAGRSFGERARTAWLLRPGRAGRLHRVLLAGLLATLSTGRERRTSA